jgi:porin
MPGRFSIYLLLLISSPLKGQTDQPITNNHWNFTPEISYIGDIVNNTFGGIKTGTKYLGIANVKLELKLPRKVSVYFHLANTHGAEPSADLFGDYQVATNIEAGNHTYLQEFWLRKSWGKFIITAGIQDLNVDVANTHCSGLYLNSSFGILPTVSGNIPAPIFPLTSIGISSRLQISSKTCLHIAAFDGVPTDFSDNPHNLNWHLSRDDGLLFFSEFNYETNFGNLPGSIKMGLYLHQHLRRQSSLTDSDTTYRNNNGLYLLGEQQLWKMENRSLGVFVQLGVSPKKVNTSRYYVGAGLNYAGLLNRRGEDVLGIAFAHDGIQTFPGNETVIELTYQFPVCPFLFLQPDIQYIINPAGSGQKLDNCLAAILRFGISLPLRN